MNRRMNAGAADIKSVTKGTLGVLPCQMSADGVTDGYDPALTNRALLTWK